MQMFLTVARSLNANRCVVTKTKRATFARLYPTVGVLPDGSTITGIMAQLSSNNTISSSLLFSEISRAETSHQVSY